MNILFFGSCANFQGTSHASSSLKVWDISKSPRTFCEDLTEFQAENQGSLPNAFLCYGRIEPGQMNDIVQLCDENKIPLILCSSKSDREDIFELAHRLESGYIPRAAFNLLNAINILQKIKEQAALGVLRHYNADAA